MRSTLFYIPHMLGPLPVFGFGWALILFVIVVLAWAYYDKQKSGSWKMLAESLPFLGLSAAAIVFLVPMMESRVAIGETQRILGLPVRGYGVMLLLAAVSGLTLIMPRANRAGMSVDTLLSLAFWSFIPGIVGARLFFVIQKWDEFPGRTFAEKLPGLLKFTEGGLVVYGGVIGGLLGMMFWCRMNRKPALAVMDLIAPGYMLGQGLGRIGCFLHGCCFGGVCDQALPTVAFPAGSPAYMSQLDSGELLGLKLDAYDQDGVRKIKQVVEGSWADKQGIQAGQYVQSIMPSMTLPPADRDQASAPSVEVELQVNGKRIFAGIDDLPQQSLQVQPIQIYSAVSALLICATLYFLWPAPRRDGYLFAIGLVLVAVSRIFEEIIRVDEKGIAGTPLTVAQWISVFGIMIAAAIFAVQSARNRDRTWLMPSASLAKSNSGKPNSSSTK